MAHSPDGSFYTLTGRPDAPVVVLIHGLGLNHACWLWLAPVLATDFLVLCYDLIGHGQSAAPIGQPVLKDLSDQLAALLDHIGVEKAALVGFSLGGMVARRFAQDHASRTTALVLLHSPHMRTEQAQAAILARVEQARGQGPGATVEAALERWFTTPYRTANAAMMQRVRGWVLANDPAVYPQLYRVLAEGVAEIIAPEPALRCPALAITADEDFGNGPEMSRAIAAEIDGAEVLILPGLRHMALAEDPAAINTPVQAFLRRVLPIRAIQGPDAIDPKALRNAFGAFATGVTVITTRQSDGTPRGFTANSFSSVSLDPPLLLVCLAKSAHSLTAFMQAPHFAVNVLGEDQKAISGLFASREADKFAQCDWRPGVGDVPMINGALAQFSCRRDQLVDAGDHLILIGRIVDFATAEGNPLGYFRGRYFSIGLEDDLVKAAAGQRGTRVGLVLADGGAVLMQSGSDGRLSLPLAPDAAPNIDALRLRLASLGLAVEVEFLYAVFDDRADHGHGIYYHGRVSGPLPEGFQMIPLGDLASAPIANAAEAQMLHRYAEEYRHGSFGIYQGNETTGTVRRIAGTT